MKRRWILGLVALLLATAAGACGREARNGPPAGLRNDIQADRAQLFAEVLRRYLTTVEESSFSGVFDPIYVLGETDGRDGEQFGSTRGAGSRITDAEREQLREAVEDLGSVTFVAAADEVIETIDGCGRVVEGGILITFGDPQVVEEHVEIAIEGFVACLGASWVTYEVQRVKSDWRVVGPTGPIAVA